MDWPELSTELEKVGEWIECEYHAFIFDNSDEAHALRKGDNPDNHIKTFVDMSTESRPCALHELAVCMPTGDFSPSGLSFGGLSQLKVEFERSSYSSAVDKLGGEPKLYILPPHDGSVLKNGKIKIRMSTKGREANVDVNESIHTGYDEQQELFNYSATILMRDLIGKSTWIGNERIFANSRQKPALDLHYHTVDFYNDRDEKDEKERYIVTSTRPLKSLEDGRRLAFPHRARYADLDASKLKSLLDIFFNEMDKDPGQWIAGQTNSNVFRGSWRGDEEEFDIQQIKNNLVLWQLKSKDSKKLDAFSQEYPLMAQVKRRAPVQMRIPSGYASHTFWHTVKDLGVGGQFYRTVEVTVAIENAVFKDDTKRRESRKSVTTFHDILWELSIMLDTEQYIYEWLFLDGIQKLAYMISQDSFNDLKTKFTEAAISNEDAGDEAMRILKLFRLVRDALGDQKNSQFGKELDVFLSTHTTKEFEFAKKYLENHKKLYERLHSLLNHNRSKQIMQALDAYEQTKGEIDTSGIPEYKYININITTVANGYAVNRDGSLAPPSETVLDLYSKSNFAAENAYDHTRAALQGAARMFCSPEAYSI